jgi:hypothetical protein
MRQSIKSAIQTPAAALVLLGVLAGCQSGPSQAYHGGYEDGQNGVATGLARSGATAGGYELTCRGAADSLSVPAADRHDFIQGCVDALNGRYGPAPTWTPMPSGRPQPHI